MLASWLRLVIVRQYLEKGLVDITIYFCPTLAIINLFFFLQSSSSAKEGQWAVAWATLPHACARLCWWDGVKHSHPPSRISVQPKLPLRPLAYLNLNVQISTSDRDTRTHKKQPHKTNFLPSHFFVLSKLTFCVSMVWNLFFSSKLSLILHSPFICRQKLYTDKDNSMCKTYL